MEITPRGITPDISKQILIFVSQVHKVFDETIDRIEDEKQAIIQSRQLIKERKELLEREFSERQNEIGRELLERQDEINKVAKELDEKDEEISKKNTELEKSQSKINQFNEETKRILLQKPFTSQHLIEIRIFARILLGIEIPDEKTNDNVDNISRDHYNMDLEIIKNNYDSKGGNSNG